MTLNAMHRPAIDYRLSGAGWLACTIRFNDAACEVPASCLPDALRRVSGALGVVAGLSCG